jgi:hypothetical protein
MPSIVPLVVLFTTAKQPLDEGLEGVRVDVGEVDEILGAFLDFSLRHALKYGDVALRGVGARWKVFELLLGPTTTLTGVSRKWPALETGGLAHAEKPLAASRASSRFVGAGGMALSGRGRYRVCDVVLV